jgi:hypothetical protein
MCARAQVHAPAPLPSPPPAAAARSEIQPADDPEPAASGQPPSQDPGGQSAWERHMEAEMAKPWQVGGSWRLPLWVHGTAA